MPCAMRRWVGTPWRGRCAPTDRSLAAMARLEGATAWQTLRHVHWPQISAPLAAAWYVTCLLCLWDVETLVLIVPPGGESLSLRVFNLLHYGHNAQVNALCLLLMALALFPLLLAAAFNLLRCHPAPAPGSGGVCGFSPLGLFRRSAKKRTGSEPVFQPRRNHRHARRGGRRIQQAALGRGGCRRQSLCRGYDRPRAEIFAGGRLPLLLANAANRKGKTQGHVPRQRGQHRRGRAALFACQSFYPRGQTGGAMGRAWDQRRPAGHAAGRGGQRARRNLRLRIHRCRSGCSISPRTGRSVSAPLAGRATAPANSAAPRAWALTRQDRIYVADSCNHRIQIFSGGRKISARLRAGRCGGGRIELSVRHASGPGRAAIRLRIRQQPHPDF